MVKSRTPPEVSEGTSMLSDTGPYSAPLFAKLVPFAVHTATNIYVERRDRLVNTVIIEELESLTTKLRELLQSLNLPGSLQALEKPLGLPPGILAHAEELKQQGGVDKLLASIRDIDKLRANNLAIYQEAVEILRVEAAEDNKQRQRHGTDRWSRPPSVTAAGPLTEEVATNDGYIKSAENTDKLVRSKLDEVKDLLLLLGGPTHKLEEFVPNSSRTNLTLRMDREVGKLRQCMNEVSRLESRRRRKIETLRQKAKADDISTPSPPPSPIIPPLTSPPSRIRNPQRTRPARAREPAAESRSGGLRGALPQPSRVTVQHRQTATRARSAGAI